jgi:hypothetical protein
MGSASCLSSRASCADSNEIEQHRQTYISSRAMRFMAFEGGIEILEGALAIGRQADSLERAWPLSGFVGPAACLSKSEISSDARNF